MLQYFLCITLYRMTRLARMLRSKLKKKNRDELGNRSSNVTRKTECLAFENGRNTKNHNRRKTETMVG